MVFPVKNVAEGTLLSREGGVPGQDCRITGPGNYIAAQSKIHSGPSSLQKNGFRRLCSITPGILAHIRKFALFFSICFDAAREDECQDYGGWLSRPSEVIARFLDLPVVRFA